MVLYLHVVKNFRPSRVCFASCIFAVEHGPKTSNHSISNVRLLRFKTLWPPATKLIKYSTVITCTEDKLR